ncbi:hypothetical protein KI387_044575, partial [Taxus chinensis]
NAGLCFTLLFRTCRAKEGRSLEKMVMMRERERERKSLIERGLSFACQQEPSDGFALDEEEDGDQMNHQQGPEVNMVGGELAALLQELAGLQLRLASLMEKMGSLPLDLIRDMRQEVVEVTDQLRNIN